MCNKLFFQENQTYPVSFVYIVYLILKSSAFTGNLIL